MVDRYALLTAAGHVFNVCVWDGVEAWTPPSFLTVIECPDYAGPGWQYVDNVWSLIPPPPEESGGDL
jgi:hypothetical protein